MSTGQGLRDVLYQQKINPITFIPGTGITNYGNKTEASLPSALDRINVARLVAFLRGRLQQVAKSFVFEPNDQQTRNELSNAIDGLMQDVLAKRGLYDYTIVCDLSNNSPASIDRNELYVDIAIEPVKAVEFIYIPVRIVNTGVLS
jgi:phage tail sheath protein FI